MKKLTQLPLLILLVAGCSAKAENPGHERAMAPASSEPAKLAAPVVPAPSKPAPSEPAPSAPAQPEAPLTPARKTLIEAFIARDLLSLSPDAASARFAALHALKRERETIDGFVLIGGNEREALYFEYAPNGKNGFSCQLAKLTFQVTNAEGAAELEQSIDQYLQANLGKPKKYSSETRYWKVGRRADASLTRYASQSAQGMFVVDLRISEPDGP